MVSGYETDGLGLRVLALAHAPKAVPTIEKELRFPSRPIRYRLFPSIYTF